MYRLFVHIHIPVHKRIKRARIQTQTWHTRQTALPFTSRESGQQHGKVDLEYVTVLLRETGDVQ